MKIKNICSILIISMLIILSSTAHAANFNTNLVVAKGGSASTGNFKINLCLGCGGAQATNNFKTSLTINSNCFAAVLSSITVSVSDAPDPLMYGEQITFTVSCTDLIGPGCTTTRICNDSACSLEYCSVDHTIVGPIGTCNYLTKKSDCGTNNYWADSRNILGNINITNAGTFTVQAPGNITGTVEDEIGTPLEGATITAQSATGTYTNTTDAAGAYMIHDVNSSTYTLTATKSGYILNTTAGVAVSPSAATIVDFILQHMPASGICEDAIVYLKNKENLIMHIGSRQMIAINAKNPTNNYALVPIHIGSPDTTFRNFLHFEHSGINPNDLNITLRPNEEKTVLIEIFAGKTGNYELVIGPDNIYENKYDSTRVTIINKNAGIFAQTPGLKSTGIILIILLASILISRAENRRFKPTMNALKPKKQEQKNLNK